jgi:uncharacterized repeat protein (TIGR03803 family)
MKKLYPFSTALLSLLFCVQSNAQGIYQLWGMTSQGGSSDVGAIFRTDGNGANIQSLYSFPQTNPGATPMYNQLTEYNGKFYSMTSQGGVNNQGVIFEWDPVTNVYIKKFDFSTAQGINPHGSLVMYNNKFYGMTLFGGSNDQGVIFEWDPSTNVYTKKIDLATATGSQPYGSLVAYNGKLYGMTHSGGANDKGVIFEWNPSTNTYTKKHDFDGTNGANPYGDLAMKDGKFYGMTYGGGATNEGVIFEWNPASNLYTKKFEFDASQNYGKPYGSLLIVNEELYGLTWGKSPSSRDGILFKWSSTTNTFTRVLNSSAILNPRSSITFANNKFYFLSGLDYKSKGINYADLFEFNLNSGELSSLYTFVLHSSVDNTFDGENPYSTLAFKNGKLYGMTSGGGSSFGGVIFEFDLSSNVYSKKVNFNAEDRGSHPNSFVFHSNKLYATTHNGGFSGLGTILEWNFASGTIDQKHQFDGNVGAEPYTGNSRYPSGNIAIFNNKFYGLSYYMQRSGGPGWYSHVFEWDPITNQFVQKLFYGGQGSTGNLVKSGSFLYGLAIRNLSPGLFKYDPSLNQVTGGLGGVYNVDGTGLTPVNSKLYGLSQGGVNNAGYIFEYEPATTTFSEKFQLLASTGSGPVGNLLWFNNKFYGMTDAGGANNLGVIFEWDPVTNIYTKKYDFNTITGGNPVSSLVENNGMLYGMTRNGGSLGLGTVFQFDPATNNYTKQSDFTGINGRNPTPKNELTKVPVEVALGMPGACQAYAPVIINNDNNNEWVPVVDASGMAVAEIRANGNNLGTVTASVFVNNTGVREDGAHRLYLDRNITITPQFQPTTAVDVRLYIRGEELEALKNATNSNGDPAGITNITELGVYKNSDGCGSTLEKGASQLIATPESWIDDYVITTSVTSFSTFYFANKSSAVLPLSILQFSAELADDDALLKWTTDNEVNTKDFVIERSTDGVQFTALGKMDAANTAGRHDYSYTDIRIHVLGSPVIYYRLQQRDIDGKTEYSKLVTVSLDAAGEYMKVYPNPVDRQLNVEIGAAYSERITWKMIGMSGANMLNGQRTIAAGTNMLQIDVSRLSKGVYLLELKGDKLQKRVQFFKN